ncbi:helix-turn-helix domain-containing protein [Myxosarcina sp. GI1]|uniref:helix-turn-helix domain-containing protein n=1 Tax=Myxosarcina sp. GI1 TaxID=1541065 RepID=UPI000562C0B6|nr:helix-turn-helix domain-containing protein [Myxosarcina sp. GI1]
MEPYSEDLRQKILDIYLERKTSIRQIAQDFKVSKSFVQKLLKQYKKTGSITPKTNRGGRLPKLNSQQINLVAELAKLSNDATLQELCNMLYEQTGVRISRPTMSRIVRKIKPLNK